eukprot:3898743-Alexandrium_andersonii.AAC.1
MSASLVGSEMCIRDRISSARVPRSARPEEERSEAFAELQNLIGPQSIKAVSYTHLTLPTICSV